jgi:hypothetical protein
MISIQIISSGSIDGRRVMAVEARQVLARVAQIEESINAAEQVVVGHVVFEIKGVEKSFLTTCLTPHHRDARNMLAAYHG